MSSFIKFFAACLLTCIAIASVALSCHGQGYTVLAQNAGFFTIGNSSVPLNSYILNVNSGATAAELDMAYIPTTFNLQFNQVVVPMKSYHKYIVDGDTCTSLGQLQNWFNVYAVSSTGGGTNALVIGYPVVNSNWSQVLVVDGSGNLKTDDNVHLLKDVAYSGDYSSLTGTPSLAPVALSGNYGDLTGAPVFETFSAIGNGTTTFTFTAQGAGFTKVGVFILSPTTAAIKSQSISLIGVVTVITTIAYGNGVSISGFYIEQ